MPLALLVAASLLRLAQDADAEVCARRLRSGEGDTRQTLAILRDLRLPADRRVAIYADLLDHADEAVVIEALSILAEGPGAAAALDRVELVLNRRGATPELSMCAARALAALAKGDDRGPLVLARALENARFGVAPRRWLIDHLPETAARDRACAAVLEELAKSSDARLQFSALKTLARASATSEPLPDPEATPGEVGFGVFLRIQAARDPRWIPWVATVAEDPGRPAWMTAAALETLGRLDAAGSRFVRCVLHARRSREPVIADEAVLALQVSKNAGVDDAPLWAQALPEMDGELAGACLAKMRAAGPKAADAVPALAIFLEKSDGTTSDRLLAAVLDVLRSMRSAARGASETVTALLAHQARVHQGRDKREVVRVRSYLFSTLADIGVPASAYPLLLDALVHVDSRVKPEAIGAAGRAVGSLGPAGRPFCAVLVRALAKYEHEGDFSLERYDARYPPEEATNARIEMIRALGKIAAKDDEQVIGLLEGLASATGAASPTPAVVAAAHDALKTLRAAGSGDR